MSITSSNVDHLCKLARVNVYEHGVAGSGFDSQLVHSFAYSG
jgi:hypothetical protein